MWIWDKLTKAEVIRTAENLKVNTLQILFLSVLMLLSYFLMAISMGLGFENFALFIGIIFFLLLILPFPIALIRGRYNSDNIILHHIRTIEVVRYIFRYKQQLRLLKAPFFINISVQPVKNNLRIVIEDKGLKIAHYTLKNGEDLTQLIDGFTEVLDLELVENKKLSKGEILSFKSRNANLPNPTSLQIELLHNRLSFKSIIKESLWLEFDFNRQTVRKYNKTVDFQKIKKIYIEPKKKRLEVKLQLNSGKNVKMLKHSTSEINIIRDADRLLETLENRQELQNIEIELIEKM